VPSGESYKAKLLQPSNNDELSVPDEPEIPVLPPVKDAGSPPMTVTEAPAGADESETDKVSPTAGRTSTGTDNKTTDNKPTRGSGAAGKDTSDDSAASGWTTAAAAGTAHTSSDHAPIPVTVEDANLPGAELSDIEKEAISDPSTAELVAAATGDSSAAVANEEPAPANVITVQPDESSDVTKIESDISAVLPGPGSKAGTPVVTAAAADQGGDNTSTVEAERELPHAMSVLTASDAAAAGLANLESQLDAGRSFNRLDSSSSSRSGSSNTSRGGSAMSRTETGNVIDLTSPAAARETLPETLLESTEDQEAAPTAAAAADTKPAGAGVAAAYGHLQQAPAAAGDAAAVPAAAAAVPSGGDDTSSSGGRMADGGDITNSSGDVAAAAVPEPAVGVEKEGGLVADAATGDSASSGAGDILGEGAAADADDSHDQNPLAAAAAAVAKPVAAAMTDLKDVLLGPDITLGESETDHSKE
jgi:hypothetical protein